MDPDADDGLTDELAEQLRREIELGAEEERRALAAVRAGDDEHTVELFLSDEDGEETDVVVTLGREQARALAAALLALAGDEPPSAG